MKKPRFLWKFSVSPRSMKNSAPAIRNDRCTGLWLSSCRNVVSYGLWSHVTTGSKTSRPTTAKPGAHTGQAPAPSMTRWTPDESLGPCQYHQCLRGGRPSLQWRGLQKLEGSPGGYDRGWNGNKMAEEPQEPRSHVPQALTGNPSGKLFPPLRLRIGGESCGKLRDCRSGDMLIVCHFAITTLFLEWPYQKENW